MKKTAILKTRCIKLSAILLFIFTLSFSSTSYALIDTTIFRMNVVQDSVYAGDTVDVDLYIGDASLLGILNILNEFEIQISTDTSLIKQDNISSQLDTLAWESFFNTTISNILAVSTIDIILGTLNIKGSSLQTGNGNARMARGKYIVQDNVAGRQFMRYDFDKAISKGLLGITNPVRITVDSILILGQRNQIPTSIRIPRSNNVKLYPNPTTDFINVVGEKIQHYKLLSIYGNEIISEDKSSLDNIQLNLNKLSSGTYILMLEIDDSWNTYRIIKE